MTDAVSSVPGGAEAQKHIVDILIEERCQRLRASPFWPVYRGVLYPLLRHRDAVRMADSIVDLSAREVFDFMSGFLDLEVVATGLEHIPATGPIIIASTHPTGIPDGIAMYDALKSLREDLIFFANRDAMRVNPRLGDLLIPVEWVQSKRTRERSRETLASAAAAFESERCVVLFPSGRIAYMNERGEQTEQPWLASVATFARKFRAPVVPAHMSARNSRLYYWFWKLNTELRDITLFHELLNKRGKRFEIRFGAAIAPEELPHNSQEAAEMLRRHAAEDVPAGRPWRISQRPEL